ncbi:MAG: nucleotide sugar dehydrogenase, partial [Deltaproteobacteria bacterium]|nr:nucleotide sugar dehydrogenase [Deltaproteobacteria bacterium]
MELFEQAREKFLNRQAKIGILGLGYAGLPLACAFAEVGFQVTGFDTDPAKVRQLTSGNSYIAHIDSERIAQLVARGKLHATCDFSQLCDKDAAIICVPTPLADGRIPDLRYVKQTAESIQAQLHRGMLVVLESTTYPGTTDEVVLPILKQTGMEPGT